VFQLGREHPQFLPDTAVVEVVQKDIRRFIGQHDRRYDVILINLPPPATLGLNRFYTTEFFRLLKNHVNWETVVCTGLPSTANYTEGSALKAHSSLWNTLGSSFGNRLVLPGERNYFLASDSPLDPVICARVVDRGIPTEYVNPFYLDDRVLASRSETLTASFSNEVPENRDFYPYIYVQQIAHWLSYFGTSYRLLVIIPVVLFMLLFLRTGRITAGLYTGGFTAASLEVALLLAYQVYFGSLYLSTALFFAFFMAGLAAGASARPLQGTPVIRQYYLLQFILALYAVMLPFLVQLLGMTGWNMLARLLIFLLVFALATGVGFEFSLAAILRPRSYSRTAGINYSTDLMGSAFGAFLMAIVLLPLVGLTGSCMLIALLNMLSGTLAWSAGKLES
jgi:spermidine synthase